MLEGKTINLIRPCGGLIAGQNKYYELWVTGGVMTITEQNEVKAIDNALKTANRLKVNQEQYLQYCIDEEDILS